MTTSQVANTQSFTLSLFWSPEVQDHGVCRAALLLEVPGEGPPLSLPALVGHSRPSLVFPSLLFCASVFNLPLSSSSKDNFDGL